MKKRCSKILSIFLAMVMVVLLLPCVGAKAATVRVWINGKEITSANAGNVLGDGSMSYNSATNTLTVKESIGADLEIKSTAGLNIDVLEDCVVQGVTKITTESDLVITGGEEITRRCLFAHQLFINTKGKLVVRTNRGLIKYGYGPSTSDAKLDITAAEVRIEPANDKRDVYINECYSTNIKTTGNMYFKNYQFSGSRLNLDCGGNLLMENNYAVDDGWRCCFSYTFTTITVNNLLKIFGSSLALWCSFCHIQAGTMDIDGKLLFMASDESEEKDFSDSYIKTTKGDMRFSSETSMKGYQLLSSAGNIYIERQATEEFSDTCLFQEGTIKADKAIYITNLGTGKVLSENSKVDFTATDGIYMESKEGDDIHAFNCTFHVPYAEVLLYESIEDTNPKKTDVNAIKTAFDYPKISILNNAPAVDVFYKTHVQTFGWEKAYKKNGQMSGTSGMAKRLEGINIYVASGEKNKSVNLGIQYTTHCQSYGWLPWSSNDEMNGTEGEAKRLEAIKIKLTGTDRDYYDVYYRVHAQSYGWLGWAKNGAPAGTAGYAKRLEGIQIVVVKKGAAAPGVNYGGVNGTNTKFPLAYYAKAGSSPIVNNPATSNTNPVIPGAEQTNVGYKTHVQTYGWQGWKYNGQVSGTVGQAKRLEGIQIRLTNKQYAGSICYTTHVQSYGWQGDVNKKTTWAKEGQMSGTLGQAKRLEAIKIALTGEMEQHYDIYYRVHAQSYGWLGWAKNGESAGTAGYAKRLEGIQIVLVPKGGKAPANNYGGVVATQGRAYISK